MMMSDRELAGLVSGIAVVIAVIVIAYALIRERDIRRRFDALSTSENRYRLAVETAPSALVMTNSAGKIVLVNREFERLFGYSRVELLGREIEMLVPEQQRATHVVDRTRYQGSPQERKMGQGRELFGRRKDGNEVPIEVGLTPIRGSEGTYVLGAVIDLSYRKQVEQALASQAAELERSNTELEQFAYAASHDLQEPVRVIRSYTEFLGQHYSGSFDDKGRKYLGYIVEGAERMHQLIGDLLLYSRAGRGALKYVEVDANALVDGVIAMYRATLRECPGASITRETLPVVCAADTLLTQLFQNLIGNALKFRSEAPPQVHIRCSATEREWCFAIQDNGIGVDGRYASRIFELFQRLHERGKYPGTGIGLAIAKRIAERHGGRIWMESAIGHGSTFFFTLPKRTPNERTEP